MKNLKGTAIVLISVGLLSMHAHASDAHVKPLRAQLVMDFNHSDMNAIFEQADQPMQVTTLSKQEMKETEGALMQFVISGGVGAGVGLSLYVGKALFYDRPITWQGALYSAGTGALIGAGGGALISAAGGGVIGNIAWRPSMMAANFGAAQYRNYRGW